MSWIVAISFKSSLANYCHKYVPITFYSNYALGEVIKQVFRTDWNTMYK